MRTSAPLQTCHNGFARGSQPFPTHDRACFGSEKKFIWAAKIIERLDAKTISSKKNRVVPLVINGEGKHPFQTREHFLSPMPIAGKKCFGVACPCEDLAESLKFRPNVEMIGDF